MPDLPTELDGLRIAHLSDFHLGLPSRGAVAVERAVAWTRTRRPDLVAITGDLLTHPRAERRLRWLVASIGVPTFAVLGNHDLAVSRDPLARRSNLRELEPAVLLHDEGRLVELRGRSVWIAGAHPRLVLRRSRKVDPNSLTREADLSILLCHFPRVLDGLQPGAFDLVLAGHMHDGQICVPYPGGKLRLAHPRARYTVGVYRSPAATMHVSAGLGTTFVPFRFGARPEATEHVQKRRKACCVAGEASISTEILARYAADAAREVVGVRSVAQSPIPGRRGSRVSNGDDGVRVELHLSIEWGASMPEVGAHVRRRVREYLQSMADVEPAVVDVVVDGVGPRS